MKFISCYDVVIVHRRLVGREQGHAGAAVDNEHGQSRTETFWRPGWGDSQEQVGVWGTSQST